MVANLPQKGCLRYASTEAEVCGGDCGVGSGVGLWDWGVDEGCELVDGGADGVDVVAEEREAVGCFAEMGVALVALSVGYELREVG